MISNAISTSSERKIISALTDVFIGQFVCQADPLRLMLDGSSIDNGLLELLHDGLMDGVALRSTSAKGDSGEAGDHNTHKILDRTRRFPEDDRRAIIRRFTFRLGVYPP